MNQTGSQVGLKNAALSWTLMRVMMLAAGWTVRQPNSSHRCRVTLLNGEKLSDGLLGLNPEFTEGDGVATWLD